MGTKNITQGTTPALYINNIKDSEGTPIELGNVAVIELAIRQKGRFLWLKGNDDVNIDYDENAIEYIFTQEETFAMSDKRILEWQLRFKMVGGTVIATGINTISVLDLMSEEVL